jgi:hypothetical protein
MSGDNSSEFECDNESLDEKSEVRHIPYIKGVFGDGNDE